MALVDAPATLPPRAETLAIAESVEAEAVREGAGIQAVKLHSVAGRLVERLWRIEGRDRDASEALDMYRAAARSADTPGACEAALAAARLAGDVAHDASLSYAELYRHQRRFAPAPVAPVGELAKGAERELANGADAGPSCRREIDDGLVRLAAFRPTQRALDAIDADLAGTGSLARASTLRADAGDLLAGKPPQVLGVESWPGREAARIVVVLDRPAAYRVGDEVFAKDTSAAIVLDLDGVDLGRAPREAPGQGIIMRVRAQATTTGCRVSIDVAGRAWRRAFAMHDPYRIVIDVTRHPPGAPGRSPRIVSRMVIDPGHGGRDMGATGPSGVKEKDVTLDVARRVAPVLTSQGIAVALTRDEDRFVSLEERTARANAFDADLFVSIHCNASEIKARRGVETYVLDTTRDEIAARLAARENATTQTANAELGSILGDLRVADQAQRSTQFAKLLERAATSAIGTKYGDALDGGVHAAGFYVLVGADMPSVLFETSYVSNPIEEQRLDSDEYRQLLADAIVNAVTAYREGR